MVIGIDASIITPAKAGIGYHAYSMIRALSTIDKENEYILYTNNKKNLEGIVLSDNFKVKEMPASNPGVKWMLNVYRDFPEDKIHIFISFSNLLFGVLFRNTLTVVHDLSQLKYPQFFSKKGSFLFRIEYELLIRRAKYIMTVSDTVRNEMIQRNKFLEKKVVSMGSGIHEWVFGKYTRAQEEDVVKKYHLPAKYFLSVSTLEPRKNYINAIRGFASFSKENPEWFYLIAGKKGWFYEDIFKEVLKLGLEKKVIFLGYVPEEDLSALYDKSSGIIYISIYEGFGLPLLEAYSRGKPVLASNIKVFKESMDGKAIFTNPEKIDEIFAKLKELKAAQAHLVDKNFVDQFSWTKTAQKLVNVYYLLN